MKKTYVLLFACIIVSFMSIAAQAEYFDFGGATVTIINQSHHPAHRFIEGDWPGTPQHGTAYGLHEEAEALFNCNIEFQVYSYGEYISSLMTRLISGDAANDIWLMTSLHYWPLLAQGAFYPVNEFLSPEYFAALPGGARGLADHMTYQGNIYSFNSAGAAGVGDLHVIVYNKDLFESLGLPDLQDVYEDGDWTWDMLTEIATQATRTDGDRVLYGMAGFAHEAWVYGLAYNNDRAAFVQEIDGRWTFTGNRPNYVETFNQVRDWLDTGILSPSRALGDHVTGLLAGEVPMIANNLGRSNLGGQLGESPIRFGIVPLPRGPRSDEHKFTSVSFGSALTLPVTAENPEGLVQLANFLYPTEDYELMLQEAIQNYAQDRRTAALLMDMHDNWSGFTARMRLQAGMEDTMAAERAILAGDRPAAGAMEEIAAAQQANLDELWN